MVLSHPVVSSGSTSVCSSRRKSQPKCHSRCFCCWCGPQVGVRRYGFQLVTFGIFGAAIAGSLAPSFGARMVLLVPPKTIVFSTVSEVTLGIFPCNSGTCSSFSGMVFCCRQVLLVVRRLTSSSSRAASCLLVLVFSCFWCTSSR